MAALPMAAGCILGGIIMEKFGRRTAHLFLNVPFIVGWIIIAISPNLQLLLVGRFMTGFCVGLLGPPASVYIGETSEPRYRGFLLAAISLAIALGVLVSHAVGTFFSWQTTAITCGLFPIISFAFAYVAPESPSWLLSKGRDDEALQSFQWLRGHGDVAKKEFDAIRQSQNVQSTVGNYSWQSVKENIRRPAFVKPLLILLGFFFTMQFTGVNAITFYSVSIMKSTMGSGINDYLAMIIIDVVRVAMSVVACVLLRRIGRRPLAAVSGIGTTVSLLGLSVFLYLVARDASLTRYTWVPMSCLLGFICSVSVGIVPLPWCMTGELFPLALRGLGSGIVSGANFLCFFVVVKTCPIFITNIGMEGAFMIYGVVALVGTVFLLICLPETKNRTLQEIENSFEGANNGKDTESSKSDDQA